MKPILFKTPDELESFIRSLPLPESFGATKQNEMIRLGREAFQARQVISKNLLGNTKGFDKYAEILGELVAGANKESFGEEISLLESRLFYLGQRATEFDNVIDKISRAVAENSAQKSLKKAQGSSLESIITGYGDAIADLLQKAQEASAQIKKINEMTADEKVKSRLREKHEKEKYPEESRKEAREKIVKDQEHNLEKAAKTLVAFKADLKSITAKLQQILGLQKSPDQMTKDLKKYCELQVEYNQALVDLHKK